MQNFPQLGDPYGRTAEFNPPPAAAVGGRLDRFQQITNLTFDTINKAVATFGRRRTPVSQIPPATPQPRETLALPAQIPLATPLLVGGLLILLVALFLGHR